MVALVRVASIADHPFKLSIAYGKTLACGKSAASDALPILPVGYIQLLLQADALASITASVVGGDSGRVAGNSPRRRGSQTVR
jgi:hypothetical protein